jgi:shikimate dehydrogenase
VTGTLSPPLTAAVGEFLVAELSAPPAAESPRREVSVAAIGTTADKPLRSPQLRRALDEVQLPVARTMAFAGADELLADDGWDIGIVLSPHKLVTAELVTHLSPSAQRTGVVDTVLTRDGYTYGVNTNTWAVLAVLRRLIGTTAPRQVLVLGSGGSTRSVLLAIERAWPEVAAVVSARDAAKAAPLVERFGVRVVPPGEIGSVEADVVINTTTWGETPESEQTPFAFDIDAVLRPGSAYFDLNNRRSTLVERALDAGAVAMSGIYMQQVTHRCRAAGLRRWTDIR